MQGAQRVTPFDGLRHDLALAAELAAPVQDVVGQCIEVAYGEQGDTAGERLAEALRSRDIGSEAVGSSQAGRRHRRRAGMVGRGFD